MTTLHLRETKGPREFLGPLVVRGGHQVQECYCSLKNLLTQFSGKYDHCCQSDETTGLFNRRCLLQELDRELARARRYHFELTVMMMDIDNFKRVNDAYGHLAGDQVLREVASIFMDSKRKGDIVGRLGGDEFFAILPHTRSGEAEELAWRFWTNVREHPFKAAQNAFFVSLSIGIFSLRKFENLDRVSLMEGADRAMYVAKRTGKNTVLAV